MHVPVARHVLSGCMAVMTALRTRVLVGSWSLSKATLYGAEGHGVSCNVFASSSCRDVYGSGSPRFVFMDGAYTPDVSCFWSM